MSEKQEIAPKRLIGQVKLLRHNISLRDVEILLRTLGEIISTKDHWPDGEKVLIPLFGYPTQTTKLKTADFENLEKNDIRNPYKLWPSDVLAFLLQLGVWFKEKYPKTSTRLQSFPNNRNLISAYLKSLVEIHNETIDELKLIKDNQWKTKASGLWFQLTQASITAKLEEKKEQETLKKEIQKQPATAKVTTPTGSGHTSRARTSNERDDGTSGTQESTTTQPINYEAIKKAVRYEHAWLYNRVIYEYLAQVGIDPNSTEASPFTNQLSQAVLDFLADQDRIELALTFANPTKRQELFDQFIQFGKLQPLLAQAYISYINQNLNNPDALDKFATNLEKLDIHLAEVSPEKVTEAIKQASPPPSSTDKLTQEITKTIGGEVTPQQLASLKTQIDTLLLTYGDNQLVKKLLNDPNLDPTGLAILENLDLDNRLDFFALVDRLSADELLSLFSLDTGVSDLKIVIADNLDQVKAIIKAYAKERSLDLFALAPMAALGTAHLGEAVSSEEFDLSQVVAEAEPVANLITTAGQVGDGGETTALALGGNKDELESYSQRAKQQYLKELKRLVASLTPDEQLALLKSLGIETEGLDIGEDGGYLAYLPTDDRILTLGDEIAKIIREAETAEIQAFLATQQAYYELAEQSALAMEAQAAMLASLEEGVDYPEGAMSPLAAAYAMDQAELGEGGVGRIARLLRRKKQSRAKQLFRKGLKKAAKKTATKLGIKAGAGLAAAATGVGLIATAATVVSLLADKEVRKALAAIGALIALSLKWALSTALGWVGGILGGIAGFFVGGPAGALAGFYSGSLAGAALQTKLFGGGSFDQFASQTGSSSATFSSATQPTTTAQTATSATPFSQTAKTSGATSGQPTPRHQTAQPTNVITSTPTTTGTAAVTTQTAAAGGAASTVAIGSAISAMGIIAPTASLGLVVFSTFFTIFTIYSSFLAPIPEGNYTSSKDQASHYLEITKTASPQKLKNNYGAQTIAYQITLKARPGYKIKLIKQTDDQGNEIYLKDQFLEQRYNANDGGQPVTINPAKPQIDESYLQPEFTSANTQRLNYTVTFSGGKDVLVANRVVVKFDVYRNDELVKSEQEVDARTSVVIGEPKVFCWPVTGRINQLPLNNKGSVASHDGVDAFDIGANIGSPVYAPAPGKAWKKYEDGGYGRYVVLKIDQGPFSGHKLIFGHLSSARVGDESSPTEVTYGSIIGQVGNTGRSTGPHLHFELWTSSRGRLPLNQNSATLLDFLNLTANEEKNLLGKMVYTCW